MEISSLLTSAKIAYDLAKGITALKSEVDRNQAVSKILEVLIAVQTDALSMQGKQSSLTSRITELENQLEQLKNWESELQRYQLKHFAFGGYAYSLKPGMENAEPPHYLCASCMNQRKKSILQPSSEAFLRCSLCPEEIQISHISPGDAGPKWDARTS
jgi:hypothetical protein